MHGVELHDIVADSTSSSARGGSRGTMIIVERRYRAHSW
jgi:hypothetical protein